MDNFPVVVEGSAFPADSHPLETIGTDFDRAMMQRCLELARQALPDVPPQIL